MPAEQYGIQLVSMAFLTGDDAPVIWRGPMLHGVIQQFFREVRWDGRGLPDRRHAAGHRRHRAQPEPDRAGRRRGRRDDAADRVARRHAPRRPDVPEAEHPDARPDREHEPLHLPELPARVRHLRQGRRRDAGRGARRCRSSAGSRSTSRSASAATPACRSRSARPDSPAAQAFRHAAERLAAQLSIASYEAAIPLTPVR